MYYLWIQSLIYGSVWNADTTGNLILLNLQLPNRVNKSEADLETTSLWCLDIHLQAVGYIYFYYRDTAFNSLHTLITATLNRRRHLGFFRCLVTTLLDDLPPCNEVMKMTTALDIFRNPLTESGNRRGCNIGTLGQTPGMKK
jgi:hypothetical protein